MIKTPVIKNLNPYISHPEDNSINYPLSKNKNTVTHLIWPYRNSLPFPNVTVITRSGYVRLGFSVLVKIV